MEAGTRASSTEGRRRAILDAALSVFLEHGVAGASVEEIRRRSGASIGSIYHHFGGKEHIAAALYLDALGDYQACALRALADCRSARAGVQAVVRAHVAWLTARPDLARYLFTGRDAAVTRAAREELRELNAAFFGAVARWVRPRVERGELRDLVPELLYALWLGPTQDLARHWLAGRTARPLKDHTATLAAAAWQALRAQEDA